MGLCAAEPGLHPGSNAAPDTAQFWLAAAVIGVTEDQVLTLVDAMPDRSAALTLRIELANGGKRR